MQNAAYISPSNAPRSCPCCGRHCPMTTEEPSYKHLTEKNQVAEYSGVLSCLQSLNKLSKSCEFWGDTTIPNSKAGGPQILPCTVLAAALGARWKPQRKGGKCPSLRATWSAGEAVRAQRQGEGHGYQEQSLGAILSSSRSETDEEAFSSDPERIVQTL